MSNKYKSLLIDLGFIVLDYFFTSRHKEKQAKRKKNKGRLPG